MLVFVFVFVQPQLGPSAARALWLGGSAGPMHSAAQIRPAVGASAQSAQSAMNLNAPDFKPGGMPMQAGGNGRRRRRHSAQQQTTLQRTDRRTCCNVCTKSQAGRPRLQSWMPQRSPTHTITTPACPAGRPGPAAQCCK
jgi:hypothetical protein